MNLATRCSACGTIFRVVEDQLRVSDGWVRCGRCSEVFDARAQLFDMDQEAPPPWPAPVEPVPQHQAMAAAPAPARVEMEAHEENWFGGGDGRPTAAPAHSPANNPPMHAASPDLASERARTAPVSSFGADAEDERREPFWDPPPLPADHEAQDARADLPEPKGMRFEEPPAPKELPPITASADIGPDVVLSPGLQVAAAAPAPAKGGKPKAGQISLQAEGAATAGAATLAMPGFMRRAEEQARMNKPGRKWSLAAASLLLGLTAFAQLGWFYREALSAQSPQARAIFSSACAALGCQIQPWHLLDDDTIRIESSGLSEAASGNHYKLSLTLRNKSSWELASPWVDLSLSDASGQLLMRRALRPEDFPSGSAALGPHSEKSLQLVFTTGKQHINGYTVDIFYP